MAKIMTKFNVDKKRLHFKESENLFAFLTKYKTGDWISDFGGEFGSEFKLHILDDDRGKNGDKEPSVLLVNVVLADGTLLGTLQVNSPKGKYGGAFFMFDNAALYKEAGYTFKGEKYNHECLLPQVTETLGLKLNNVTEMELTLDGTRNANGITRSLIKRSDLYDMFLNGKKVVDDNKLIENYLECYSRTRKRLNSTPTLYASQAKGDLSLRIYNKSREIQEASAKDYITSWDEFGNQDIYRIEITIRNEAYKDFNSSLEQDPRYSELFGNIDSQMLMMSDQDFLQKIWTTLADRILYFREKFGEKRKVTLLDIAQGYRIPRRI